MNKYFAIASFLGATAVILGAFAAHALKETLEPIAIESIQTAVRYQMFHAITVLFVNLYQGFTLKQLKILNQLFVFGVLFFSGSIYAIYLLQVPAKTIWFVTPLGGLLLVLAWIFLLYLFVKKSMKKSKE